MRGTSSRALWRVRPYLRPYAAQLATMVVASLSGIGAALAVPLAIRRIVDGPIARGDRGAVLPLTLLVLALGLAETFLSFLRRWVQAGAANGFERALRNELYAHLQRLPVSFHDRWQSGQLLSRAMADLSVIRRFVGFGLVFLVVNSITFVFVIGLLARVYVPLALVTAASIVPLAFLSGRFRGSYTAISRRVQDQQGDLTTLVEEAATGIRVIKAFGRGPLVSGNFAASARRLHTSSIESVNLRATFWSLIDLVPNLTLVGVLLVGALAVGRGSLSLGGLVAFMSLVLLLVWPMESLGSIVANAKEADTAAARIFEVLDTVPEVDDRPGAIDLVAATGHLRLSGVGFKYPGSDRWALRGVDLDVAPGETLALVGATGSGKTSLLTLLPRLYDVTEGRVELDGHDLRDLTLASLRGAVGVAFDDPLLFSASVRENLLLGWPDATEAELETAIVTAQAEFVHDLPWGLDTRVGEQGLTLSGGQRQRLALARAIVGRPAVLVLDDPLSSLDVHTEALVEQALARVLAATTALVAVHRPSTLALADRVAYFEAGALVALGPHAELAERLPGYRAVLGLDRDAPGRVGQVA
ncbi:MAG TPA: ABC transporter ATP-binding protein [Acidimicrobiales bacterium]|nr:ABC transporter ATP-binding protein [Acidimicrobiales bacterium]